MLGENDYGKQVMSKVVMILSELYDSPQAEWILWSDQVSDDEGDVM